MKWIGIKHPPSGCLRLFIPNRVSFAGKNVAFNIHPECNKKVKYYRWAHGKKREVNKIQPDPWGGYIKFLSQVSAHAKGIKFNKISEAIHRCVEIV